MEIGVIYLQFGESFKEIDHRMTKYWPFLQHLQKPLYAQRVQLVGLVAIATVFCSVKNSLSVERLL